MTWEQKSKWQMVSETHTIAKSLNVPKPYTLYHTESKELIGCYETLDSAKAAADGWSAGKSQATIADMSMSLDRIKLK